MPATIITIADAVVTALSGASLSLPFVVQRVYVPISSIRELTELTVSIVPVRRDPEAILDRTGRRVSANIIDCGIQQTIGSGPMTNSQINAVVDPLMLLGEEIIELFLGKLLPGVPDVGCTNIENLPIFAPFHLDEQRVFTSLLTMTFKLGAQ